MFSRELEGSLLNPSLVPKYHTCAGVQNNCFEFGLSKAVVPAAVGTFCCRKVLMVHHELD